MKYLDKIHITKSFSAPYSEYSYHDKQTFENGVFTNQGPLIKKFESKLRKYLNLNYLHYVANGTIALQLALDAINVKHGEIITTPFSYVASTSAILWERCKPIFCDIEEDNFTIDASKIESLITKETKAILAVNVFGYVCDFVQIEKIAKKHNLYVIYDSAHCFGANYKGKSVFSYGDISTCSFHATKIFHTREGGAIFVRNKALSSKIELTKRLGHDGNNHKFLGINAKNNESNAAMGLANFPYIDKIISSRKKSTELYDSLLGKRFQKPLMQENLQYNYSYYPIIFDTISDAENNIKNLESYNIYPRRYFYPSLNTLGYIGDYQSCPVSENISSRIVCLPLWVDMDIALIENICKIILGK